MTSSLPSKLLAGGLAGAIACGFGCGGKSTDHPDPGGSAGTLAGQAGTGTDNGGSQGDAGGAPALGTSGFGTSGFGAPSAGGTFGAGTTGSGGTNTGGGGTSAGVSQGGNAGQSMVVDGCGLDSSRLMTVTKYTLTTSGTKAPDATGIPGPWSYERQYIVRLPKPYDSNRHYPLLLQLPECGGDGNYFYSMASFDAIRVGLAPPPNAINNAARPGRGCFDDAEGDDSVDIAFYEQLLEQLKTQICYDPGRVFATGIGGGARLANQLGCKYAGSPDGNAIRGIAVYSGGLPTDPAQLPTCSPTPMPGMWLWESADINGSSVFIKAAIKRAMAVNGCASTDYDTATFEDYPIGNSQPSNVCKKIVGCPAQYPLVTCLLPGSGQTIHDEVASPGFATFFNSLIP
jgi:poly(3-hydroxybutyrate) depolymerase